MCFHIQNFQEFRAVLTFCILNKHKIKKDKSYILTFHFLIFIIIPTYLVLNIHNATNSTPPKSSTRPSRQCEDSDRPLWKE